MYIIVVKHKQPTENTIMNEQNKKNKFDDLEKEITVLKERVAEIEKYFKVNEIEEEKPETSFM